MGWVSTLSEIGVKIFNENSFNTGKAPEELSKSVSCRYLCLITSASSQRVRLPRIPQWTTINGPLLEELYLDVPPHWLPSCLSTLSAKQTLTHLTLCLSLKKLVYMINSSNGSVSVPAMTCLRAARISFYDPVRQSEQTLQVAIKDIIRSCSVGDYLVALYLELHDKPWAYTKSIATPYSYPQSIPHIKNQLCSLSIIVNCQASSRIAEEFVEVGLGIWIWHREHLKDIYISHSVAVSPDILTLLAGTNNLQHLVLRSKRLENVTATVGWSCAAMSAVLDMAVLDVCQIFDFPSLHKLCVLPREDNGRAFNPSSIIIRDGKGGMSQRSLQPTPSILLPSTIEVLEGFDDSFYMADNASMRSLRVLRLLFPTNMSNVRSLAVRKLIEALTVGRGEIRTPFLEEIVLCDLPAKPLLLGFLQERCQPVLGLTRLKRFGTQFILHNPLRLAIQRVMQNGLVPPDTENLFNRAFAYVHESLRSDG